MENKRICKNCKKCIGHESDPEGLWCAGKIKGPTTPNFKCISFELAPKIYRHLSGVSGKFIKEYRPTGEYCLYMQIDTLNGLFYAPSHEFTYLGKNYNCE